MNTKRYGCGMILGRFQPFHIGHKTILERALEECYIVYVLIGSTQESRVSHNPLTFEERCDMIRNCFPEELTRIHFIPIQDRATVSNDQSWGEYLFNILESHNATPPDVIYEGREPIRKDWWDTLDVDIIQITRKTLPISGTNLRKMLLEGDNNWRHYCPKGAEKNYLFTQEVLRDVTKD